MVPLISPLGNFNSRANACTQPITSKDTFSYQAQRPPQVVETLHLLW